jgi:GT2 family glycosyltransferase
VVKVSVILPVHNGAAYIGQALETVLGQSLAAHEVIVVDDGSTDDTLGVLAAFSDRIRVLVQCQRGPSAARNRGLEVATGEYVAFLDADDEWESSFLSTTVAALQSQPELRGVCTGWLYVDQDGRPLRHTYRAHRGRIGLRELLHGGQFPIHAALTRREAVLRAGGFDERLRAMEDWDLWLRLTAAGGYFGTIPEHLARYRLHGPSNSGDADRMRHGRLLALEKLFHRTDLAPALRALEPYAYSIARVDSSAALYGANRVEEGKREFAEAVRAWPRILESDEPYYALACAEQPVGHKATSYPLDLKRAERRLVDALDTAVTALGWSGPRTRGVFRRAYRVLARCSALQQSRAAMLRYTYLAATHELVTDDLLACVKTLVKSTTWFSLPRPKASRP